MKKIQLIIAIFISVFIMSCSNDTNVAMSEAYEGGYAMDDEMSLKTEEMYDAEAISATSQSGNERASAPIKVTDRKIIREGDISFKTDSLPKTAKLIHKTVKELKGYISKDNVNDYGYRTEQVISVRVPAENFDKLLSIISNNAESLDSKNISARDVTEEYIDVQSRIKTKKDLEKRYTEILQKAYSVSEILQIERELGKIRSEIESAEGRLRYLKNNVSFSTLSITFYTTSEEEFGFADKLVNAIEGGWNGLLWFLLALIYIWPFILIFALGGWLLVRLIKRRRKKKALNN